LISSPLFRSRNHLVFLGLLGGLLSGGIVFFFTAATQATVREAVLLLLPALALEMFLGLLTWYLCRFLPLEGPRLANTVAAHLLAGLSINFFWLASIYAYSQLLDLLFETRSWSVLFNRALFFLAGIGLGLYVVFILLHYLIMALEKTQAAEQEALEQKLSASQAELSSLKSTLHPHFLFNSLAMLPPLIAAAPQKAESLVGRLSDFLLYSLRYSRKVEVPMAEELEHVRNFLEIEGLRLGERLQVEYRVDPSVLNNPVIPFILQPLVENAIKHGIRPALGGGTLSIVITAAPAFLQVMIRNPYKRNSAAGKSSGLGLETLRKRLAGAYGDAGRLGILQDQNEFTVELQIPRQRKVS
jgi:sensor histidine kinase YesM